MPSVRLWLLLLLLLPLSTVVVTAQTFHNVSLGSSLSTNDENPSWVSPSGEFSFGFYRLPDGDRFLLAIWFDKIPEKTVVWSANGDEPVQGGSKVELTTDGRLILSDVQDEEIWRAESTSGSVASAAMLDTGNFVLRRTDSVIVWESFNVPTDTILPSQILGLGSQLSSHLTRKAYSKGRFQLRVQADGNLVFYPVNLPTESRYSAYWASNTVDSGYQLIFNTSGYIYFTQRNGSMFNLSSENGKMVSTKDFYHRATLDFDGVFRQYIYPKNHSSSGNWAGSWSVVWYEPRNLCTAIRSEFGSGACGFNSYCKLDDDQRPSCECPPEYSYLDPNNTFGGCKQDFVPQSCDSGAERLFELREMTSTDWPLSDSERYNPINEDQCRQTCLSDCFCAVAIFRDGNCWKKKLPLSNGKMDPSVGGKALIKVSRGNFSSRPLPPPSTGTKKNERRTLVLILSVLLGSSVFLNFLFLSAALFAVFFSYHKKLLKIQPEQSMMGLNLRCFTYKELEEITDGFKEELGRGAFAIVYKGVLASNSQNFIAVKKLDMKEAEKGFRTEAISIGQTHHKNLVKLLGFCEEGLHRLLVYEFMRNGSLSSFLFEGPRPSWNKRMQIAFGIARGLTYLHEECGLQIIHCDIKPQNILLDDSFTARISDFGMSKLLKTNQSRTTTCVRGTKGYLAPEWFRNMPVTVKVDVYSFGVILLEIICCRKNIKSEIEDDQDAVLTYWASDCYRAGRLDMLIQDDAEAQDDMRRMERVAMVALWCIQEDPSLRPSMKKVAQMLEGTVEVSVPPNPCSFISSIG